MKKMEEMNFVNLNIIILAVATIGMEIVLPFKEYSSPSSFEVHSKLG